MTSVEHTLSGRQAATLTAERLRDPAEVAQISLRPGNVEPIFGGPMWAPMSLTNGLPGTAMLYAVLARDDAAWLSTAHRHIADAAQQMSTSASNGLFAGPAALLAVVQQLDPHYDRLRSNLTRWVADDQRARLAACRTRVEPGVAWHFYDVVNGLSGTARLLLVDQPEAARDTLEFLIGMTEPIVVDDTVVPGWWVPSQLQPIAEDAELYPRGDFNLGLAHGVTGPLALFTQALEAGVDVPGLRAAAVRIGEWLLSKRQVDGIGAQWPCRLDWDEQQLPAGTTSAVTRAAWCYGTPGVAHTLFDAGRILGREHWCEAALTAMRTLLRRDPDAWLLDGPTFCHGHAGLLWIARRLARASADAELNAALPGLEQRVLAAADPEAPFVFQHQVPDSPYGWTRGGSIRRLDGAGLLEGAAGVALSLIAEPSERKADWDAVFLLS